MRTLSFFVLLLLAILLIESKRFDGETTTPGGNTEEEEFQKLINDVQNVSEAFSKINYDKFMEKRTQKILPLLPLLPVIFGGISAAAGVASLGLNLFNTFKPTPENPFLQKFDDAMNGLSSQLSQIEASITSGIDRIIDHDIHQDFENEVTSPMVQLEGLALSFLYNFTKDQQVPLVEKCKTSGPMTVLTKLSLKLPNLINVILKNDPLRPSQYESIVTMVLGLIKQFILVFPTCNAAINNSTLTAKYGQKDDPVLNYIKTILQLLDNNVESGKQIFKDLSTNVVKKICDEYGDVTPASQAFNDDLRNRLTALYNYDYAVYGVHYKEPVAVDYRLQYQGNFFMTEYNRYTVIILASTERPKTACHFGTSGMCRWEDGVDLVALFNNICPDHRDFFAGDSLGMGALGGNPSLSPGFKFDILFTKQPCNMYVFTSYRNPA